MGRFAGRETRQPVSASLFFVCPLLPLDLDIMWLNSEGWSIDVEGWSTSPVGKG